MLSAREQFICLLDNYPLEHADFIICLTGGGLSRAGLAAKLWKEERGKCIIVTGGLDRPPFSLPASQLECYLLGAGVPATAIICDNESANTREQAVRAIGITRYYNPRNTILVASDYHQYRAYLTFLKAMRETNLKFRLIPATVRNIWAPDILDEEFRKIETYQAKGHCASFEEGVEHINARIL